MYILFLYVFMRWPWKGPFVLLALRRAVCFKDIALATGSAVWWWCTALVLIGSSSPETSHWNITAIRRRRCQAVVRLSSGVLCDRILPVGVVWLGNLVNRVLRSVYLGGHKQTGKSTLLSPRVRSVTATAAVAQSKVATAWWNAWPGYPMSLGTSVYAGWNSVAVAPAERVARKGCSSVCVFPWQVGTSASQGFLAATIFPV